MTNKLELISSVDAFLLKLRQVCVNNIDSSTETNIVKIVEIAIEQMKMETKSVSSKQLKQRAGYVALQGVLFDNQKGDIFQLNPEDNNED